MKQTATMLLFLLLAMAGQAKEQKRLVIITVDGMRWQELFGGADAMLVNESRYVKDVETTKTRFWRATAEERREVLMPFVWSYVVKNGYLLGNRNKGSQMQVANSMWFSYPGYSEIFCGYADDERINDNAALPNPNHNVLEAVAKDPRYKGSVCMYGSWESTRYCINTERAGIPASVAYEKNIAKHQNTTLGLLDEMLSTMPRVWGSERFDSFTFGYALETLKQDHPKVMWVSFGDTDEFCHESRYDAYLDACHATDFFIRRIVETCEADEFYRGKTTYIVTCDHGRGIKTGFVGHGSGTSGSNQTWFMAFGNDVEKLGETMNNGPHYNQQFAATIADILGVDFTPDNGIRQKPLDPHYRATPLVDETKENFIEGVFPAVKATKKGKGLRYTYYEGKFQKVADIVNGEKKDEGIVNNFRIDGAKTDDHFGFVFSGLIDIQKGGRYILSCTSDDGSKVWIDGREVIDNDGGHSDNLKEASVDLEKGLHRIEVHYFEDYAGESLMIGIEGSGVSAIEIPDAMLFHE